MISCISTPVPPASFGIAPSSCLLFVDLVFLLQLQSCKKLRLFKILDIIFYRSLSYIRTCWTISRVRLPGSDTSADEADSKLITWEKDCLSR